MKKKEKQLIPEYIVGEVELVYKANISASERPEIKSSRDCYDLILRNWNMEKIELLEEFKVIYLNRANRVIAIFNLSSGGISGTVADIRLIFVAALKANTSSIILAHNHPSGKLVPSNADEILTKKIKDAGLLLDIKVLDHLIITSGGYYSFFEETCILS
ncbi:JAB domain-containing protein [Flavihumibacter profundi]|uniref:JAB domain-containing protein n=1 Tax=Flavihumibacter profundi TaxID=2716883 RepID=UPI001CC65CC0|nr:JAB domain-containing protein [Flavihumibacter profundi]MBZ5857765.1 JAB domain-containing protein [Flavihumibacter profundi]